MNGQHTASYEEPTPWGIHRIGDLYDAGCQASADGKTWHLAVALPYPSGKLKAAWWVLTGKAYAFKWPKLGDLERASGQNADKKRYRDALEAILKEIQDQHWIERIERNEGVEGVAWRLTASLNAVRTIVKKALSGESL